MQLNSFETDVLQKEFDGYIKFLQDYKVVLNKID